MKSAGIVRKVDAMGRIVIPKPVRDSFSIDKTTSLHVFIDEDSIVLQKNKPGCCFCGEITDTLTYNKSIVCYDCITALYETYTAKV